MHTKIFDVKGKIVLITGASRGIGASVVRALLDEDVKHVTILDIDEINGFAIQDELNMKYGKKIVKFINTDVTKEDEVVNAFRTVTDEQGYIDLVINNAGLLNDKKFARTIEVNCTALVRGTVQAWDMMRKDKGGRGGTVINISSIAAIGSVIVVPIYSATKAAVLKLGTTLGHEHHYSRTGVRILTICFGLTDTPMAAQDEVESFDKVLGKAFSATANEYYLQTPEQAARGVLQVYNKGTTGSVWVVTNGEPAVDVTDKHLQSIELYTDLLSN